jgi:hypothetical protein
MKNQLSNLFYMAEEYQHYNNEEYKEVYEYISELVNNVDNIEDEDLKYILTNWKYKNLVYKTLQFNSLWTSAGNTMFLNILKLLSIRDLTKYTENTAKLELHIDFDNKHCFSLNIQDFKKLDETFRCFHKKTIHIKNGMYFTGELYDYLMNNDYYLIYEIEDASQIQSGTFNINVVVTENNIDMLENIIQTHMNNNGRSCFFEVDKSTSSNVRNKFRKLIEDFVFKYSSRSYIIESIDYIPTNSVGIDFNNNIYLKNNFPNLKTSCFSMDKSVVDIINTLKKELIEHNYLSKRCLTCDEKILCLMGVSNVDCFDKIL